VTIPGGVGFPDGEAFAGFPDGEAFAGFADGEAFAGFADGEAFAGFADGEAFADCAAHAFRAAGAIVVALPPETARMTPSVRPSAMGMARGTAMRAVRVFLPLLPRRRHADRCPLSIQSTSMDSPLTLPVNHRRPAAKRKLRNQEDLCFVGFETGNCAGT
jgi:hypothetical protein